MGLRKRRPQGRDEDSKSAEGTYLKGEVSSPETASRQITHNHLGILTWEIILSHERGRKHECVSWNHSLEMVLQGNIEVKGVTSVPEANSNKRPSPVSIFDADNEVPAGIRHALHSCAGKLIHWGLSKELP